MKYINHIKLVSETGSKLLDAIDNDVNNGDTFGCLCKQITGSAGIIAHALYHIANELAEMNEKQK